MGVPPSGAEDEADPPVDAAASVSAAPQAEQNLEPAAFSTPQAQATVAGTSDEPHEGQNLAPPGTPAPHEAHAAAASLVGPPASPVDPPGADPG